MNINRIRGGRVAQKAGRSWEDWIQTRGFMEGFAVTHIKTFAQRRGRRWFPEKSTIDYIIGKDGQVAIFDTKSINADRFPHSLIDISQLGTLLMWEARGFSAGYLIFFRKIVQVSYFKASIIEKVLPGSSLTPCMGISAPVQEFRLSSLLDK